MAMNFKLLNQTNKSTEPSLLVMSIEKIAITGPKYIIFLYKL
jgi:hypothetical protein